MNTVRLLLTLGLMMLGSQMLAQDIERLVKAKKVDISGSIFGSVYNSNAFQADDPSVGFSTGANLQFSFFEHIKIPLSFQYANSGTLFNTPQIGRIGVSPSYKFIQLHAGYRSYVLNQFLLRGKTILGGGIELKPKKFSILVFAGQVRDPYSAGNEYVILGNAPTQYYKRMMFGAKLGIGNTRNRSSLSFIRTTDLANQNSDDIARPAGIQPHDNLAVSIETNQTIFKTISLQAMVAGSILTSNRNGTPFETDSVGQKWLNDLKFLIDINSTSRYSMAYQVGAGVQFNQWRVGLRLEHIDPFYSTLGISYIQNNFSNYLLDISGTLFNTIHLLGNIGIHQINADGWTGRPQRRIAVNTNLHWRASKKLSLAVNYSNYVQKPEIAVAEVMDSLSLTSNNTGWNGSLHYKMGSKESPHSLNLYGSSMHFDIVNFESVLSSVETFNSNVSYKYSPKNKFNYSVGVQYNTNDNLSGISTVRTGFLMSVSKVFSETIQFRVDGGYRWNKTAGQQDGSVINLGANLTYAPHPLHKLGLAVRYLKRNTQILAARDITNVRANYTYSF